MSERSQLFKGGQPQTTPTPKKKSPRTRKKVIVQDVCERLNCDPVEVIALIANGDAGALNVPQSQLTVSARLKAATTLLEYTAPKKRAVDTTVIPPEETNADGTGVMRVVQLPTSGRETVPLETPQEADSLGLPDAEDDS